MNAQVKMSLNDCCEFILDGTHGSPVRAESGIPVLSATNVNHGRLRLDTNRYTTIQEYEAYKRRLKVQRGDVLLTIVGTIGRSAVVETDCDFLFQRSVAVLRPKANLLDSRFLFHLTTTQEFQSQISSRTNTSTQAGLYLGALKTVQVPIPPLDEQCRIASILDKADAVRQKRQATIDLADQLTQAVYLEMFGDPVTNPMGWPLSRLDQLTTHITDGKHGDCRPCPGSGHYFISVKDIVNGRIMYENAREIEPADFWDVHKRTRFDVGDLLITNSGTIGKTAVATEHPLTSRTTFQKSVAVVKPIPSSVAVQFLKTYIDLTVKELSGISSGSAQKNLLLGQLRELPIVFPPIALQREYSRRLLQINRLKQSHLDALVTIDALVSSLQNAMFSAEADIGRQFLEARVKATPSGV